MGTFLQQKSAAEYGQGKIGVAKLCLHTLAGASLNLKCLAEHEVNVS